MTIPDREAIARAVQRGSQRWQGFQMNENLVAKIVEEVSALLTAQPDTASEDVVERFTKAIKNWCLLHSAYVFTDEKAKELATAVATSASLLRQPDNRVAELKSAEEWLATPEFAGVEVLDPDGWNRKNYEVSWNEKISAQEFNKRLMISTCSFPEGFFTRSTAPSQPSDSNSLDAASCGSETPKHLVQRG